MREPAAARASASPVTPLFPGSGRAFALVASGAMVLAAIGAVVYYRLRAGTGYPLDDSWIHLAFARNFAHGQGFGANPGETSTGATSPLWVVLLSAGFLAGLDHTVWPWLLAAITLGLSGVVFGALVQAIAGESGSRHSVTLRLSGFLCGLCVVWTPPLVWSAAGAMEVPLFVLMTGSALLAFARSRAAGPVRGLAWGAAAGLASLARPEGLVLLPILAASSLARWKRRGVVTTITGLATGAVVYAPSVFFCLQHSGRLFPATLYAKTTALVAGAPDARFLADSLRYFFTLSPVPVIALALGLAHGAVTSVRRRAPWPLIASLAFALGLPLAYAVMGRTVLFTGLAGNFGRYLYPVLPPALAGGFWAIDRAAAGMKRRMAAVSVLIAGCLSIAVSLGGTIQRSSIYKHNVDDINSMQVAMARRLQGEFPEGSLIAANDVGALAYLTRFRVLDLIGIISRPTLDALEAAGADPARRQNACYEVLVQERPAALVVFPQWFGPTLHRLGNVIEQVEVVNNPSNITSGGNVLFAFRMHWENLAR
jgi:hypothetical protein